MPHRTAHFGPALFDFLSDLRRNNRRDWFQANKNRYERDLRGPCLRFITDFGPRLRDISPHFRADPRPVGGSLFRIHRDTRFSGDKSPYKTASGIQFRHDAGKDVHAPGFYLHLEPGNCFVGAGVWRPDSAALALIREAIVEEPEQWTGVSGDRRFRERFQLGGESLFRAPRGYDASHPLIDDLKRKDFVAMAAVRDTDVTAPGFIDQFEQTCRDGAGLVEFLCRAMALPF